MSTLSMSWCWLVPVDWRNDAACRGQNPELFFPIGTTGPALTQLNEAKAVCASCAVKDPCLQWSLRSEPIGQESGVCGGLSEAERRALKRRAARTPQHPAVPASATPEG